MQILSYNKIPFCHVSYSRRVCSDAIKCPMQETKLLANTNHSLYVLRLAIINAVKDTTSPTNMKKTFDEESGVQFDDVLNSILVFN